jgi:hypothetical protein
MDGILWLVGLAVFGWLYWLTRKVERLEAERKSDRTPSHFGDPEVSDWGSMGTDRERPAER